MDKDVLKGFELPGSEYRGAPFWAWNGKLETEELRRQIRMMKEMGLGGFFMHSRVGLNTKYLSDEWFDCVRACVDEAGKLGMRAWLYDEDRWPSGAAGGLVTCDPAYRGRKVELTVLDAEQAKTYASGDRQVLGIYAGKVDGQRVGGLRRIGGTGEPLNVGESVLHFAVVMDDCSPWFNGYTYLDTLNPEAVGKFIEVTHEVYRREIGESFGGTVPGIFTDEPHYGHDVCGKHGENRYRIPWTGKLPSLFLERYGYDIVGKLPELFFDVEGLGFSRARLNYIDCITHMFVEAFGRLNYEWCEKNGMLYTGHVLMEDCMVSQGMAVGSAMRFYEYMQAPGMDLLTEHWTIYDTAKQVSSVARQFGRKWRLTETYGCTGWDFPFSGHKALGDWQAALGINLRCQHLAWYTMAAEAKRDYPASISYQSPWWRDYSAVEDYFARINYVMTMGSERRDLLCVHPIESAWTMMSIGWREDAVARDFNDKLTGLRHALLSAGLDFDYGDEDIMSRHGSVEMIDGRAVLKIGQAEYRAVVIPEMITVRASTLELLERFRSLGGTVVGIGAAAKYVDGLESGAVAALLDKCVKVPSNRKGLIRALGKSVRALKAFDEKGKVVTSLLHQFREASGFDSVFICNTGLEEKRKNVFAGGMVRERRAEFPELNLELVTEKSGGVLELDLQTGTASLANAERIANGWRVRTSMPELGSRLFLMVDEVPSGLSSNLELKDLRRRELAPESWDARLSEDNVLVFDRFRWSSGEAGSEEPSYVLSIDDQLRDMIGVQHRGGAMVQPWAERRESGKELKVRLSADFMCSELPSGNVCLALETPDLFEVRINGMLLSSDSDCGWWCDRSLRKLPVESSMLRRGMNELTLEGDFNAAHPGLEMCYLLGNFGVGLKHGKVCLNAPVKALRKGDWVGQGLPFYGGSVQYSTGVKFALKKGERLFVTIPEYRGVALRVLVDGEPAGLIAWPPQELEITELIKNGTFELGVEVIGSRRNSHGPFYCKDKWPAWTGPGQFKEESVKDYQLVPCGIMSAPILTVRK